MLEYFPCENELKGFYLHGLNNDPSNMDSLCNSLNKKGFACFRLSLAGHRDSRRLSRVVSLQQWEEDVAWAVEKAQKESTSKNVPLFLLGYSLGGLLSLLHQSHNLKRNSVDGLVLMAPAIGLKGITKPMSFAKYLPGPLFLPSLNHPEYRFMRGANFSMYKALNEGLKKLELISNQSLEVPILLAMDKKDGLVDYCKVKARLSHINSGTLSEFELDSSKGPLRSPNNHLILDAHTLGEIQFSKFVQEIYRFSDPINYQKASQPHLKHGS